MTEKQRDYQRIYRLVIDPLGVIYGKPYEPEAATALVADLSRFSDQTLSDAVAKVRQEQEYLPKIATLVAACKACQTTQSDSRATDFYSEMQARNYRARDRANAYLDRFELSQLAATARTEGWRERLMEYVTAAAHYQAQLIERVPNPGYLSAVYRWAEDSQGSVSAADEAVGRFLAASRQSASQGEISVDCPGGAIRRWKSLVRAAA